MPFADDLKSEVQNIFKSPWTIRDGQVVPEPKDVGLGNDGVRLSATVLYADIDGSTAMVDALRPEVAGELYKTYLLCCARILRSEGGEITAYDGDRVMAVFIGDSKNSSAARSALKINYAVRQIVNPCLKAQYPSSNFVLKQVVGVDTGVLVSARTGIRGANDLVWVGSAANYAAKLTSMSEFPFSTYITEAVYTCLNQESKLSNGQDMWEARVWNGKVVYRSLYWWSI